MHLKGASSKSSNKRRIWKNVVLGALEVYKESNNLSSEQSLIRALQPAAENPLGSRKVHRSLLAMNEAHTLYKNNVGV